MKDYDASTFPAVYGLVVDEEEVERVQLPSAPVKEGMMKQVVENGRTLSFKTNPSSNEGIAWITPKDFAKSNDVPIAEEETILYPVTIPGYGYSDDYRSFVHGSFIALREIVTHLADNSAEDVRFSPVISDIMEGYVKSIIKFGAEDQKLIDASNIIRCLLATSFQADNKNWIAKPFLEWVNYANVNPATSALSEIMNSDEPLKHPMFWQCLTTLVLRNILNLVIDVLKTILPSITDTQANLSIQQILYLLDHHDTELDSYSFNSWKEKVEIALEQAKQIEDNSLRQNITTIFEVLAGNQNTILGLSSSWFEAMGAFLCYIDPTRLRLEEFYNTAVEALPVDETVAWEEGCSAVIRGHYFLAIEKVESLDSFAATVVCEACQGKLLIDNYSDIRNFLLINFAKLCVADPVLASDGIDLLALIRTEEAREIFAEAVIRQPLDSFEKLSVLIQLARDFQLDDTVKTLNKITAKNMEAEGNYVEALVHLEMCQDRKSMVHFAWKLFEETLISGVPSNNIVLIDAVKNTLDFEISSAVRSALAPYAVLVQAFEAFNANLSTTAAQAIAALLKFPFLPVKYFGLIFLLAGRLLGPEKPRSFKSSEIILLMKGLEKWESNNSKKEREAGLKLVEECVRNGVDEETEKKMGDIKTGSVFNDFRVLLVREVARAYSEGF